MSSERIDIMIKAIRPGLRAVLTYEQDPSKKWRTFRKTNIISWTYTVNSDKPNNLTPNNFIHRLAATFHKEAADLSQREVLSLDPIQILERFPYPGQIRSFYCHPQDRVTLSINREDLHPAAQWAGWIYITPETMRVSADDDTGKAEEIMQNELAEIMELINEETYAIEIEQDGQVLEHIREVTNFPNPGMNGENIPCAEVMDNAIRESHTLTAEEIDLALQAKWKEET